MDLKSDLEYLVFKRRYMLEEITVRERELKNLEIQLLSICPHEAAREEIHVNKNNMGSVYYICNTCENKIHNPKKVIGDKQIKYI